MVQYIGPYSTGFYDTMSGNLFGQTPPVSYPGITIPATGYPTYGLESPVLGSATEYTEPTTTTPTGGGGGLPAPTGDTAPAQPSGPSPWDLLQENWGSYISDLDNVLNSLSGQKAGLESQVTAEKESTLGDVGLQLQQGQQQLGKERTETKEQESKSLKDIGSSVAQAMKAGNIYLGNLGVTSPSAMNQYAYALSKVGTRERSNVKQTTAKIEAEINARAENLQNLYNQEKLKVEKWADSEFAKIGSWYNSAVMQIQQQKAQDRQTLSQQILDQALSWLDSVKQFSMNKQSALDEWVINNAQNIEQVKANLAQVANYNPEYYQPGQIAGTPSVQGGNVNVPLFGYGRSDEDQNSLFGGQ